MDVTAVTAPWPSEGLKWHKTLRNAQGDECYGQKDEILALWAGK